jgi:hypothetical protein
VTALHPLLPEPTYTSHLDLLPRLGTQDRALWDSFQGPHSTRTLEVYGPDLFFDAGNPHQALWLAAAEAQWSPVTVQAYAYGYGCRAPPSVEPRVPGPRAIEFLGVHPTPEAALDALLDHLAWLRCQVRRQRLRSEAPAPQ